MSFSSIKPTKPELDKLKSRKQFLIKGKDLLEIKRAIAGQDLGNISAIQG